MKPLLVVTLMMFSSQVLMAQNSLVKFNQDGEFASLTQATGPNSSITLQVSRNFSMTSGTSASISYLSFAVAADFSSLTFTQIVGAIPSTDFTGQNTQDLVLSFNTGDLDPNNSFSQTCTVDLNTLTLTCGPPLQGVIQLEFKENGAQRTRVLALGEEITVGPTTTRIHQRADTSTANVTGSIFGTSASGASATVGVNHNSSLEVVRN